MKIDEYMELLKNLDPDQYGVWQSNGAMLANNHETYGGIVDYAPVDFTWFVVFNDPELIVEDGIGSKEEAIGILIETLGLENAAKPAPGL